MHTNLMNFSYDVEEANFDELVMERSHEVPVLLDISTNWKVKQPMNSSAFAEIEFFLLIVFSIILPVSIYSYMMWKKAISRKSVLGFGLLLIAIAGISIYLLQRLNVIAKTSPSLLDDRIFASEISIALYLLPLLFVGIGINLISDTLIRHLDDAERRYDQEHR